jgi:hypothetical protein
MSNLMMETWQISETLAWSPVLTQLIAREDFIVIIRRENFKFHVYYIKIYNLEEEDKVGSLMLKWLNEF